MTYDQLPSFLQRPDPSVFLSDNYIVLDFETTNTESGTALCPANRLLLACWRRGPGHPNADRGQDCVVWGHEFSQGVLADDVRLSDFVVAHYTKFELGWLARCGLDLRTILPYCTMLGEKVIAGNRRVDLSLDATARRRSFGGKLATAAALIKGGVCPSQIPPGMLEDYCVQDVVLTEKIFLQQRNELADLGLLPVVLCRNVVTPALTDIEFKGMCLDTERVNATWAEYNEKFVALSAQFAALTGGINFRSPPQVAAYLYDTLAFTELTDRRGNPARTAAGARRTDKATVEALVARTPEQRAFKKLFGKLSQLKVPVQELKKMKRVCDANPSQPIVHATYNQAAVQTDRLSSHGRGGGPQFHNFIRDFKRLFRARRDGWLLGEGDAPQLEFRVAALLGHDEVAKADISSGVDVHAVTAQHIGCERQAAKSRTFRPLYGGNSGTPRERAYYDFFRRRYDGIYRTQTGWTHSVVKDKCLVTPWGLRFYWPAEMRHDGYVTYTTQIFNYPIQSFATADIIPLTLALVWHNLSTFGDSAFIINTVHDSIVIEFDEKCLDSLVEVVVECFTKSIYTLVEGIYGIKVDVPLGVGWKAGTHWGSGAERKFEPSDTAGASRVATTHAPASRRLQDHSRDLAA